MWRHLRENSWGIFHFLILFAMLLIGVVFSDSRHEGRLLLQRGVFDEFNRWNPRQAEEAHKVVIIDIDEKSLELIGQWPWPRNVMAELVDSLAQAGVKAIAFDGVFGEPDRSSPKFF